MLLLSRGREIVEETLRSVGADTVKVVKVDETEDAEYEFFMKLAKKNDAGVVIMPPEGDYFEFRDSLESQLPWLQ